MIVVEGDAEERRAHAAELRLQRDKRADGTIGSIQCGLETVPRIPLLLDVLSLEVRAHCIAGNGATRVPAHAVGKDR
jgi:hypothetical protein